MPIEDFIIEVYCLVEAYLKKLLEGKKLRRSGPEPCLTDAELITMEIVGEFIGYHEDKAIWNYFKSHWNSWFPKLGSRKTFVTQAANLWRIKEKIQEMLATDLKSFEDDIHFFDGFPLRVCHFKRAGYSNNFRGEATYGYCAAKAERYYGFKGHLIISSSGLATRFTVAPAHEDERNILPEIANRFVGLLIADKGLIRPQLNHALMEKGINLQTPLRGNMRDKRPKWFVKKIVSMRRLIETVISQLTERFNIENIRAKKLWHFLRQVTRKLLAHTFAFAINKNLNHEQPLQFQHLIIH